MKVPSTGSESPVISAPVPGHPGGRRYFWLASLVAGYIGIYLCRKNFSVAVPLLQKTFHASRGEIGAIASYGTIAYAAGKFLFGGVVDRVGGRVGFLASLLAVALMGIAGGLAPSLGMLAFFYSLNRFAGAAGWPAMVKLAPGWFSGREIPFAMALLSLSFVAGGAVATVFAGFIARASDGSWQAVMALPSLVLLALLFFCWRILPRDDEPNSTGTQKAKDRLQWADLTTLFANTQFWIVCALSFTLTLLRETFNTWTVDFIKTEGGAAISNEIAAFLSTPFDIVGGLGILAVGWLFGRLSDRNRKLVLFIMLGTLGAILYNLPAFFRLGLAFVTTAIGVIGFLTYGPYSLLSGTFAVEVGGRKLAGAVSGMVDGFGYLAGILAGAQFGRLVDLKGYKVGFEALAGLAIFSAFLCIFLRKQTEAREGEQT